MAPGALSADVIAGKLIRLGSKGSFRSDSAVLRATWEGSDGNSSGLRFTYLGPTKESVPLADGELRSQIGLKLRARDPCNVIYVMWHLSPDSRVEVSVKSSPDMNDSNECKDRGYQFLKPETSSGKPPRIEVGKSRLIEARIEGRRLEVRIDGQLNWVGELPDEAFRFDGPAGLRADNVSVELEPIGVSRVR